MESFTDPDELFLEEVKMAQKNGTLDTLSLQYLRNLRTNCDRRASYFHKMGVEVGYALRKVERFEKNEAKKAQDALEKSEAMPSEPTLITINAVWNNKNYPVKIVDTSTQKALRDLLYALYPGVFTKKMLKRLRWMSGDSDLSERPRRELGNGKTGNTGWKLQDGASVKLMERGLGGGGASKRSRSSGVDVKSKEIAMKEVANEIDQACLRFNAMGFSTDSIKQIVEMGLKMKNATSTSTNPDDALFNVVSQLSDNVIMKLQAHVCGIFHQALRASEKGIGDYL